MTGIPFKKGPPTHRIVETGRNNDIRKDISQNNNEYLFFQSGAWEGFAWHHKNLMDNRTSASGGFRKGSNACYRLTHAHHTQYFG